MEERTKFHVGLDVHKDNISVAAAEPAHIPHIEFVNRPEFPPHGGGRSQILST